MDRRGFLGALAAAMVLRKLPAAPQPVVFPLQHQTYALGFTVSKQLLRDDRYTQKVIQHARNYRAGPRTIQRIIEGK